mmetsp:Transcript_1655/g.2522  ORF Transcript_1655/g.2522 Transcript_1655/m.2522 type:complete len:205 (+) Transcript_1655:1533-2147(+)
MALSRSLDENGLAITLQNPTSCRRSNSSAFPVVATIGHFHPVFTSLEQSVSPFSRRITISRKHMSGWESLSVSTSSPSSNMSTFSFLSPQTFRNRRMIARLSGSSSTHRTTRSPFCFFTQHVDPCSSTKRLFCSFDALRTFRSSSIMRINIVFTMNVSSSGGECSNGRLSLVAKRLHICNSEQPNFSPSADSRATSLGLEGKMT